MISARERAVRFCRTYSLSIPVLEAPMAGMNSVERSVAIANGGGMAAMGALLSSPDQIEAWAAAVRAQSDGPFQINLWMPDPLPIRDKEKEAAVRAFVSQWGPKVGDGSDEFVLQDFSEQCGAIVKARPTAVSSIMGVFPESTVAAFQDAGIAWFATATTLAEARAAQRAGADAVIAQSFEAGGHRGAFDNANAEQQATGMISLLPRLADHIDIPIIAAGGIADGRGLAAALTLGASAVQIGTALLRSPESRTPKAWANALAAAEPEGTMPTRAFSGRLGRALVTEYVRAMQARDAPPPAPYPVQRGITARMREDAISKDDVDRMQAWAGQSAWMAPDEPAGAIVTRLWNEAQRLLA